MTESTSFWSTRDGPTRPLRKPAGRHSVCEDRRATQASPRICRQSSPEGGSQEPERGHNFRTWKHSPGCQPPGPALRRLGPVLDQASLPQVPPESTQATRLAPERLTSLMPRSPAFPTVVRRAAEPYNVRVGRLAQLVRAPALHAGCRGFESLIAHLVPLQGIVSEFSVRLVETFESQRSVASPSFVHWASVRCPSLSVFVFTLDAFLSFP